MTVPLEMDYKGAAGAGTLDDDLGGSTGDTTIVGDPDFDWSGYPDGSDGSFTIDLDSDQDNAETILCETRVDNVFTVFDDGITNGRGYDDTAISAHAAPAVIRHVGTALDSKLANSHMRGTEEHGADGNIVGENDLAAALALYAHYTFGDDPPDDPEEGWVWMDSSGTLPVAKVWDGTDWIPFSGARGASVASTTGTPLVTSYSDGGTTYDVWTFPNDGSFTVDIPGLADMLVIGGGGGGGNSYVGGSGGGGGGGAVKEFLNVYLAAGAHTVTVGAGGAKAAGNSYLPGSVGGASRCGPVSVPGGGGGGGASDPSDPVASALNGRGRPGVNAGGSGATASTTHSIPGGISTAWTNGPAGSAGGSAVSVVSTSAAGGGGGGGGSAGGNGATNTGGAGGAGVASSLRAGTPVTYAGGGGGGGNTTGGAGTNGGGAGGSNAAGSNGTANTGGGGGGAGIYTAAGGDGGSGLVVVRIARP